MLCTPWEISPIYSSDLSNLSWPLVVKDRDAQFCFALDPHLGLILYKRKPHKIQEKSSSLRMHLTSHFKVHVCCSFDKRRKLSEIFPSSTAYRRLSGLIWNRVEIPICPNTRRNSAASYNDEVHHSFDIGRLKDQSYPWLYLLLCKCASDYGIVCMTCSIL